MELTAAHRPTETPMPERRSILTFVVLLLLVSGCLAEGVVTQPERVAVVVGAGTPVAGSGIAPYPAAEKSAAEVAQYLRDAGFTVTALTGKDASFEQIESAVDRSFHEIGEDTRVFVFYFAGRAFLDEGETCLAPADASRRPAPDRLILAAPFLEYLAEAEAARVLAVFDLAGPDDASPAPPAPTEASEAELIEGGAKQLFARLETLRPELEAPAKEWKSEATSGPRFEPPERLAEAAPLTPPAGHEGCRGTVWLYLVVTETGFPEDVQVAAIEDEPKGCAADWAGERAVEAGKTWRYNPARLNGFYVPKRLAEPVRIGTD